MPYKDCFLKRLKGVDESALGWSQFRSDLEPKNGFLAIWSKKSKF